MADQQEFLVEASDVSTSIGGCGVGLVKNAEPNAAGLRYKVVEG